MQTAEATVRMFQQHRIQTAHLHQADMERGEERKQLGGEEGGGGGGGGGGGAVTGGAGAGIAGHFGGRESPLKAGAGGELRAAESDERCCGRLGSPSDERATGGAERAIRGSETRRGERNTAASVAEVWCGRERIGS